MNAESPDRNLAIDGELQESVERDLDFKLGLLTNSIKPRVSQLPFILIQDILIPRRCACGGRLHLTRN